MTKNVYDSHSGMCPKCGEKLPTHWKDDKCPLDPKDTSYIRICPNCGESLFCELHQRDSDPPQQSSS